MQISEVAGLVENDEALRNKLQNDPLGTLETMAAMPLQTDVWIYRVIVFGLSLVTLSAVFAGVALAAYDKPTPEGVIALGSTALGAIAGLLAPSPSRVR